MEKEIFIIVALDEKNAIGKDLDLLCHLPEDLKNFKRLTLGQTVVMGRKTFESLPKGALPKRQNIVITRDSSKTFKGCDVARSLEEAIELCTTDKCFIIGGGEIYKLAFPLVNKMYVTKIRQTFATANVFFPDIEREVWKEQFQSEWSKDEKHLYAFAFYTYTRK